MKLATNLAIFAVFLISFTTAEAQVPTTLRHSFDNPGTSPQPGPTQGSSVAVYGSHTVVGAPHDDLVADNAGSAKVYDTMSGALLYTLTNPSPTGGTFGWSVGVSDRYVVVGAYNCVINGYTVGRVYVYDLQSATPTTPALILENPEPTTNDYFGWSVAIWSSRVVVGAFLDDPVGVSDAGSVYLYDLSGSTPATPKFTLRGQPTISGEQFGYAVAINGNGVVIGAPGLNGGAGNAFLYALNSSGTFISGPVGLTDPSYDAGDAFGSAVAISGSRVVVGAPKDDTGAGDTGSAYVYDTSTATPSTAIAVLNNPSPNPTDHFGASVAISGSRVAIGAPDNDASAVDIGTVYLYDVSSATPTTPTVTIQNPVSTGAGDNFGLSVATDGVFVVAGAPSSNAVAIDAGAAYMFNQTNGPSSYTSAIYRASSPTVGDLYGTSIALGGALMVVGSPYDDTGAEDAGGAYVYDLASATPTSPIASLHAPTPSLGDNFGLSVAISGTRVFVGEPGDDFGALNSGSVYVYDMASATPTTPVLAIRNPTPGQNSGFGRAVAVSGNRLVAINGNRIWVFDLAGATPLIPVVTITNPATSGLDTAVAISGTRVVVGTPYDGANSSQVGNAYVYDVAGPQPTTPSVVLANPAPTFADAYGAAVAISGDLVVVGARQDDAGGEDSGRAYVFDLAGATPTIPVQTLENPNPAALDCFGAGVAISGTRAVVGTYGYYTKGAVCVYDAGAGAASTPIATLTVPNIALGTFFGCPVSFDGFTVAAGAPHAQGSTTDRGTAYVLGPASKDTNGNGLLDIWEYAHFGSLTGHTATDDSDGDGLSDLLEQAFNADPLRAEAQPVPAPVIEGGFLTLTIAKRAGVTYTIQSAGSPNNASFSGVTTTVITNNATTLKVRDNVPVSSGGSRFLRARATAAP